jgi:hypothetical protein
MLRMGLGENRFEPGDARIWGRREAMQGRLAEPRKTAQFNAQPLVARTAPYTGAMSTPRYLPPRIIRTSVPSPKPVSDVMRAHDGLAQLGERLEGSRRRMRVIAPALPGLLINAIQPGPLDEDGWSLLVANAAVAAKLRHLLPRLESLLAQAGMAGRIRVKLVQK